MYTCNLTTMMLTWFGKSLGNVEKVAVMNMAVPTPSVARSTIHTNMKPQVDGIFITNLHNKPGIMQFDKVTSNKLRATYANKMYEQPTMSRPRRV